VGTESLIIFPHKALSRRTEDAPVERGKSAARLILTLVAYFSKAGGCRRVVGADRFFVGPLTSVLAADELLTEIQLPKPAARAGDAYVRHRLVAGD
jgi:hypothetical protein